MATIKLGDRVVSDRCERLTEGEGPPFAAERAPVFRPICSGDKVSAIQRARTRATFGWEKAHRYSVRFAQAIKLARCGEPGPGQCSAGRRRPDVPSIRSGDKVVRNSHSRPGQGQVGRRRTGIPSIKVRSVVCPRDARRSRGQTKFHLSHRPKNLASEEFDTMHAPTPPDTPLAQFFQLVPDGLPPRRADKSVGGVIPARALRYCEAITSASAFGWYVFLPMNFKVVWDGHDMLWTYPGVDEWLPLTRDAVQYPGFREHFDQHAPEDVRGGPRCLSCRRRSSRASCKSGPAASPRLRRAGSLLVRGVANLSKSPVLPDAGRHHRNRHLVRPAVRQRPPAQDRRPHRVPRRRPLPAGPAGPKGILRQQIPTEFLCEKPG